MLKLVILFIFLAVQSNFVLSKDIQNDDYRAATFVTTENHKLIGHTLSKRKATDVFDCAYCLLSEECKSFNYNEKTRDCYMNARRAKGKDLLLTFGYIYGEKVSRFKTRHISAMLPQWF